MHTGGLNRYCKDLMENQKEIGNEVQLLYPGKTTLSRKTRIVMVEEDKYEIVNPLPVAITYGIDIPERYMAKSDRLVFDKWLAQNRPDVIHVHSIQGIYREFYEAAKNMNIPMIFTTHDYYPICFKCTLLKQGGILCQGRNPEQCAICNYGSGLDKNKQLVLKSTLYQWLKKNPVVKIMKEKYVAVGIKSVTNAKAQLKESNRSKIESFDALGKYYDSILKCFTLIHANSPRTYEVYHSNKSQLRYRVIPITHSGLKRLEHIREKSNLIRFGYMGGMLIHKGYYFFQKALQLLDEQEQTKWEAWYYGGDFSPSKYDKSDHRKHFGALFSEEKEAEVWGNIDVLIVPCMCGETYGFVVLEALSKGIPVICSDLTGSKFLIEQVDSRLVFAHENIQDLVDKMKWIMQSEHYVKTVKKITTMDLPISMRKHTWDILSLYQQLLYTGVDV